MTKYFKTVCLFLFVQVIFGPVRSQTNISQYQFRETIELINFVESAADYFTDKGDEAFQDFGDKDSRWFFGSRYLFLYNLEGKCIFHPANPELQGQNLIDLEDMNRKPVIQYIVDIASRPVNSQGWVHYLWAESGEIFPTWKSAYIMRVEGPDGTPYALGSGTYDIRIENKFMIDVVDSASILIAEVGEAAFDVLMDKRSVFYFSETYVFVITTNGEALVDPAFPGRKGRKLMDFRDMTGKYVVKELIERLEETDKTFMAYMWPLPGQTKGSKKIVYGRKVTYDDKTVIVGSGVFQINPVWYKY